MNLKHEPITITLDRIDLLLAEPEVIKPMPNTLQRFATPKRFTFLNSFLQQHEQAEFN